MNAVTLIGNLGADPELKVLGNGASVLKLRIATSERWTDKQSGEKKEKTTWHYADLYDQGGKRASALANLLAKGDKIALTGSIDNRQVDKDGVKTTFSSVKVNEIELLGGKKNGAPPAAADDGEFHAPAADDADIPF